MINLQFINVFEDTVNRSDFRTLVCIVTSCCRPSEDSAHYSMLQLIWIQRILVSWVWTLKYLARWWVGKTFRRVGFLIELSARCWRTVPCLIIMEVKVNSGFLQLGSQGRRGRVCKAWRYKETRVFTDLQLFRLPEHTLCGKDGVGEWKESRQLVRNRSQLREQPLQRHHVT